MNTTFRRTFLLGALLFAGLTDGFGQSARLIGRASGDEIRLLWLVSEWSDQVDGFVVSRRAPGASWQRLTPSTITPSIDPARDLSEVEPDAGERERLARKLRSLIDDGLIEQVDAATYLAGIRDTPEILEGLEAAFIYDYDYAIIEGFGLIDRSRPSGDRLEYGLFAVRGGTAASDPTATWLWDGSRGFSIDTEVTVEPAGNGLLVSFSTDAADFDAFAIKGFNVYRGDGTGGSRRIGDDVVPAGIADGRASGVVRDENADRSQSATYAVAAVDAFGTEAAATVVTYDAAQFIIPDAPVISGAERAESGAMEIEWTFATTQEPAISGFIVERIDDGSDVTNAVSSLLPPSSRTFSDASLGQVGEFVGYHVVAIRNGIPVAQSPDVLIFASPFRRPPTPGNLRGTVQPPSGDRTIISLTWDPPTVSDTLTQRYHLYANRPPDPRLLREASLPQIINNRLEYEVFDPFGATYYFQVAAVAGSALESDRSDTLSVYVPARKMRDIDIWPFRVDSNQVSLSWEYEATPDLIGFRLYRDGALVADTDELTPDVRQSVRGPLTRGETFAYEIEAVGRNGVVSRRSQVRRARIRRR